jgi:hypothetical protein
MAVPFARVSNLRPMHLDRRRAFGFVRRKWGRESIHKSGLRFLLRGDGVYFFVSLFFAF